MSCRAALLCMVMAVAGCGDTTYEFQPVEVGGDQARTPRPRSNGQYVRAVYADLVGRAPDVYDFVLRFMGQEAARFPIDEALLLELVLDGVDDPTPVRARLVAGLVESAEVTLPTKEEVDDPPAWIAEQFRRFLGREPTTYELSAFVDEWDADEAVGPRTVVRAILGSREYGSY